MSHQRAKKTASNPPKLFLPLFSTEKSYNSLDLYKCKQNKLKYAEIKESAHTDSKSNQYGNAWRRVICMDDRFCCSLIMFVHLIRFWFLIAKIACEMVTFGATCYSTQFCYVVFLAFELLWLRIATCDPQMSNSQPSWINTSVQNDEIETDTDENEF